VGPMVWIDYALIGVVTLSALISLFRGFVKEALSLAGWVLSFFVATQYTELAATFLEAQIDYDEIRHVLAFLSVFLATLIVFIIISRLIVKLIRLSALSGVDRVVGVFFGLLRGGVLVMVVVLLGSMTSLAAEPAWTDSVIIVRLQQLTDWIVEYMQLDVPGNWQVPTVLRG